MKTDFDLVVIGGGPAGSTLATLAKKYNQEKRILILEREQFPRHHIGESTLPGMIPILSEMGVLEKIERCGFVKKVGAVYVRRGQRPWSVPFKTTNAGGDIHQKPSADYSWQVRRAAYDQVLLEHAEACGVTVRQRHAVKDVTLASRPSDPTRIEVWDEVAAKSYGITAGLIADCSGQTGLLSRRIKIRSQFAQLSNVAVYAHYRCDPFSHPLTGSAVQSRIVLRYVRDGWLWFIPLSADTASVGFVCKSDRLKDGVGAGNLHSFLEERLKQSRPIWKVLRGRKPLQNVDGTGRDVFLAQDYSFYNRQACGNGWITAGDAAYFVDPIISSGVFMAHMTGMRAAYTISTRWNSTDAAFADLCWRDYNFFVQKLSGSFIQMALYWYQEKHSVSRWCRLAQRLTPSSRAREVSRLRAFVHMTTGLAPYKAGILNDESYWTNARMTLAVLANDRKWKLERPDPLPRSPAWRPRIRCSYTIVRSAAVAAGTGLLKPDTKLIFRARGEKTTDALLPAVSAGPLHLALLKGIARKMTFQELTRESARRAGLSADDAERFTRSFLQEMRTSGYIA